MRELFKDMVKMKLATLLKHMFKVGFFISLIFLILQGYKAWLYFDTHPQKSYEWDRFNGQPPQELQDKIILYNTGAQIVYICLLFYVAIEVSSYFEDKNKHWVTWLVRKYKEISVK